MTKQKRRFQFSLRSFFVVVTAAAILTWYLRPPPTPAKLVAGIRHAKSPSEIPSLLRKTDHLNGEEIRSIFDALTPENDGREWEREFFLADPCFKNLYLGGKEWAEANPEEVLEWNERELTQKDIKAFDLNESAFLAVLTGIVEGLATHELDKACSFGNGFDWYEASDDALACGMYPEIEKRPIQQLTAWADTLLDESLEQWTMPRETLRQAVRKRVARDSPEEFIKWIEDDSDMGIFEMREPHLAVGMLASFHLDRAIKWVEDLEKRRPDKAARKILGYQDVGGARADQTATWQPAYVPIARRWCERDRHEFIDWAMKQLRQNPTEEIHLSWHTAIRAVIDEWPEVDLQYVEKAVFILDGGAVNFPGIYWYLHRMPNKKVLELSEKWLGEDSVATESQKNEMRKAFGHAIMWFDPSKARQILVELKDKEERRIFLSGVEQIGKDASPTSTWSWSRWRHDTGIQIR